MKQTIIVARGRRVLIADSDGGRVAWYLKRFPRALVGRTPVDALGVLSSTHIDLCILADGAEPIAKFLAMGQYGVRVLITSQDHFDIEALRRWLPKAEVARFGEFEINIVRSNF